MASFAVAVVAAHSMTTGASAPICVGNKDDDYDEDHPNGRKDPSSSFHPKLLPAVHCASAAGDTRAAVPDKAASAAKRLRIMVGFVEILQSPVLKLCLSSFSDESASSNGRGAPTR
jgi:hypothetical protein